MKIAVAAAGEGVSAHFGHCDHFVLGEIENGKVLGSESVPNPGHSPGSLPPFVASLGAKVIITGGMGARAVELFEAQGVSCIMGFEGSVESALQQYAEGVLSSNAAPCSGDHGEGGCH